MEGFRQFLSSHERVLVKSGEVAVVVRRAKIDGGDGGETKDYFNVITQLFLCPPFSINANARTSL